MNNQEEILGDCKLCHLAVRHIDDYVKVEDYIKGRINSTTYFHRDCYRNTFNPLSQVNEIAKQAKKILAEVNN